MPRNTILCSTSTFIGTNNHFNHFLITKLKPDLVYHGFEIFMFDYYADNPDVYDAVAKIIVDTRKNGAVFYSMHMNKRIGDLISRNEHNDINDAVKLFESNCKYAVMYGVKLLVLHLWGGGSSDKNIDVNIRMFPKLKEISDNYGLLLTIENVVCNTYKPLDHMRKMWELYPKDIRFTIDVRLEEFHKSLRETCESSFLWENNLVSHLHISDYRGGYMDWPCLRINPPLNSGDVDFDYFFSFLKSIHFDGSVTHEDNFTCESEDLLTMLNRGYDFIADGLRQ